MVATVSLLMLISLLQNHFNSSAATWQAAPQSNSNNTGIRLRRVPYVFRNDIKPRVNTTSDRKITVGLQITNIYGLSLKDRTFMAEGWYWLKWPEAINEIIRNKELAQEKLMTFTNQVESNSMFVEAEQPNPLQLQSGEYWQDFHFSGKFYIADLALRSFPFDDLQLPITLQIRPDSLSCNPENPNDCISLVFGTNAERNALGRYIDINGYNIIGSESREFLHEYLPIFGNENPSGQSTVQIDTLYRANFSAAFWAYIFPLLILIGIAIISPSLPGSLGDVRLAIPTTILLTLIFLQMGYKSELPALDYVSYLDWLYIYAYAVSAALFLLFCWGTNAHATASLQGNEESALRRINRMDTLVQGIAFGGLLLVLASGLLFQP